jgi:sugar/nucleoside kinase (ribokinase family)
MTQTSNAEQRAGHPDISIVGEINPDLILYGIPRDLEEDRETLANGFTLTLGSSSAILAHNLSILGTRVALTSCIGSDIFGELCCRVLGAAGVELSRVVHAREGVGTGVTLILPLPASRRILTYPGAMFEMGIGHLDIEYLATARHFHVSSLFLHRKLLPDIPALFLEMKRRGLTTSLDTNDDPAQKWGSSVEDLFPMLDILFCTEQELVRIARVNNLEGAVRSLSAKLPVLVVKRGAQGASVYANGVHRRVDSLSVTVVDTIGAGDSFDAGFLHQWLRGAPLDRCLAYGNVSGAFSVTRSGGTESFQDRSHKEQFFAEHWNETQ